MTNNSRAALDQIAVHLQEVMCHAAVKIIESLDRQMHTCEEARSRGALPLPPGMVLRTFFDEMEDVKDHERRDMMTPIAGSDHGSLSTSPPYNGGSLHGGSLHGASLHGASLGSMSQTLSRQAALAKVRLTLERKRLQCRIRKRMGDLSLQVQYTPRCCSHPLAPPFTPLHPFAPLSRILMPRVKFAPQSMPFVPSLHVSSFSDPYGRW